MRSVGICLAILLWSAPAVLAQTPPAPAAPARVPADNRIPVAAFDLRGTFASFGQDALTASDLGVTVTEMKSKSLGLQGGVQFYPWRGQSMALGIGGEGFLAANSFDTINATTLKSNGIIYDRRLRGVSGQVSLNFGHTLGWSYLTVGGGPMSFESYLDTKEPDGLQEFTINYGGGARWFRNDHLAFTVDMRFYGTVPTPATLNTAGRLRHSVFVMSAGISIK